MLQQSLLSRMRLLVHRKQHIKVAGQQRRHPVIDAYRVVSLHRQLNLVQI